MTKFRLFSFNFLIYAGIAFIAPYIVLYYQGLGFSGAQIGLLTGIAPLVTLVSVPLWTGLADATRRHRFIMNLAILLGVLALILFPFLDSFAAVLLNQIFLYAFVTTTTPLADSAALFMLGEEKELYGRIRIGATLGYGLAAPLSGALIFYFGLRIAFYGCAVLFLMGLLLSQKFTYGHPQAGAAGRGDLRILIRNPHLVYFLILAFTSGAALAGFSNYLFPTMKAMGAPESVMGLAITVGMISEIPLLFIANRLLKMFKANRLILLAMAVTGLRLLLFSISRTPGMILVFQLLNGLTFPVMWVAGVSYADEIAPAGMRTSIQGIYNAITLGFGSAVGGMLGGPLLESLGGRGLYLVFGVAVLVITGGVALLQSRLAPAAPAPAV